jgi:signal transduction histidine kinase
MRQSWLERIGRQASTRGGFVGWLSTQVASVRKRTTFAATVVVGLALLVALTGVTVILRASLTKNVVDTARNEAYDIALLVRDGNLPNPLPLPRGDIAAQVLDAEGKVVAYTINIKGLPPLVSSHDIPPSGVAEMGTSPRSAKLSIDGNRDHRTVIVADRVLVPSYLVPPNITTKGKSHLSAGISTKPVLFYVVTIASLASVDASVSALTREFLIIYPLILFVVATATWILTRRALATVDQIREDVEEITAQNLASRVFQPPGNDEVAKLARTMNSMLARLEDSATRQKQFIADASHELRSPLSALRAALEVGLLHEESTNWPETATLALQESDRMQRLIEDLLMLAKAEAHVQPRRVPVDLDEVVRDEVWRLRHAQSDVSIVIDQADTTRVIADPEQLRSVVRNLLENAVRYARSAVTIALARRPDSLVLTVGDDGPGIPEDQRDAIFERFRRLDPARTRHEGGYGLGLPIVRGVVTLLGGTIEVGTAALGGAEFRIRLPLEILDDVADWTEHDAAPLEGLPRLG